jgi:succinate dehydrogenase / fumarate reductase cytochrome b subunit
LGLRLTPRGFDDVKLARSYRFSGRWLPPKSQPSMATATATASDVGGSTFFLRHEFAIRRLHSLSGIVPLGAYMVVHLTTNASLLNGPGTFQRAVYLIHSLGRALPIVEWGFIFAPLLFHAIVGVWIWRTGKSNTSHYRFSGNKRYKWQRVTGLIAFVYLMFHVLHLHGWVHLQPWVDLGAKVGFAQFRAYNAASTLAIAMDGYFWPAFYLVGVWACIYHLANGLWTAGITWGLWISESAQERATKVCVAFGILLTVIGTSAWYAAISTDPVVAKDVEDEMFRANINSGLISNYEHKRTQPDDVAPSQPEQRLGK